MNEFLSILLLFLFPLAEQSLFVLLVPHNRFIHIFIALMMYSIGGILAIHSWQMAGGFTKEWFLTQMKSFLPMSAGITVGGIIGKRIYSSCSREWNQFLQKHPGFRELWEAKDIWDYLMKK